MTHALIIYGGWEGHRPAEVAAIIAGQLREHAAAVEVHEGAGALETADLGAFDVIVPVWARGIEAGERLAPLLAAVAGGAGLATFHGGIDFIAHRDYAFMVGGHFIGHPGDDDVSYTVHIDGEPSAITEGLGDFEITSEQYYMHVDPGNTVLATTRFDDVVMPVTWTRQHGEGRVFYCSLAHTPAQIRMPPVLTMLTRGILWAARR
jgi:type 1 glutamine amidotransferase